MGSVPNTYITNIRRTESVQQTLADMLKHVCKGVLVRALPIRKEINRTWPPEKWMVGLIGTRDIEHRAADHGKTWSAGCAVMFLRRDANGFLQNLILPSISPAQIACFGEHVGAYVRTAWLCRTACLNISKAKMFCFAHCCCSTRRCEQMDHCLSRKVRPLKMAYSVIQNKIGGQLPYGGRRHDDGGA